MLCPASGCQWWPLAQSQKHAPTPRRPHVTPSEDEAVVNRSDWSRGSSHCRDWEDEHPRPPPSRPHSLCPGVCHSSLVQQVWITPSLWFSMLACMVMILWCFLFRRLDLAYWWENEVEISRRQFEMWTQALARLKLRYNLGASRTEMKTAAPRIN